MDRNDAKHREGFEISRPSRRYFEVYQSSVSSVNCEKNIIELNRLFSVEVAKSDRGQTVLESFSQVFLSRKTPLLVNAEQI